MCCIYSCSFWLKYFYNLLFTMVNKTNMTSDKKKMWTVKCISFRSMQEMSSNVRCTLSEWLVGFLTAILSIWSILPAHLRRFLLLFSCGGCFIDFIYSTFLPWKNFTIQSVLPVCYTYKYICCFEKNLGSFNVRKWRWK